MSKQAHVTQPHCSQTGISLVIQCTIFQWLRMQLKLEINDSVSSCEYSGLGYRELLGKKTLLLLAATVVVREF